MPGNSAAATSAAQSVVDEIQTLGNPAVFADRRVAALVLRGRSHASAKADWTSAAELLDPIEDKNGYRGKALAALRRDCVPR